jgi:SAM-dependent methyltransferase
MATRRASDEQRLAFGRVAELYDRARPSYPAAVVDELIAFAGVRTGDRVLEVGAGTGKLTCLLSDRGLAVLALEPSGEMAELAKVNCERDPLVEIEQVEPGGTLAAIWTFPDWAHTHLRDALRDAYRIAAPDLQSDFPMHPASEPTDLAGDWHAEIEASAGFAEPEVRKHPWRRSYSSADYLELLQTHQDHILLVPATRERLLTAVAATIDAAGGEIVLSFVTRLCLARRA